MKLSSIRKFFSFEPILAVALAFAWNQLVYSGSKLITKSWHHYDMTLSIDPYIPFIPWTIIIYFGCYILWISNYYLCARQDKPERDRFFCADMLAKIVCLVIFIAIPTTNTRPIVGNENVWDFLMRFLYKIDTADNLFPSVHCLMSWLSWVGIRKRKDISPVYRYFSLVFALAVCISTLTTRQHVIVDVFAGIALAELAYFAAGFKKTQAIYSVIFTAILKLFKKKKV